jgi:hypothetical protein
MSKSFNAAFSALVLASVLGSTLALAGCDEFFGKKSSSPTAPNAPSPLVTSPDTDVSETASAEPGRDRRQWRADSARAKALTGNVTTSTEGRGGPLLLAYATGITISADREATMKAAAAMFPGAPSFAEKMNVDKQADVYVYRVSDEGLSPSAAKSGGLCGADRTAHVVVSEFVGKEGNWALRIAAFRGQNSPGTDADPQLCDIYQYSVQ